MVSSILLIPFLLQLIKQAQPLSGPPQNACSRRVAFASLVAFTPAVAEAYERRDVGGEDRSPEQAAYNARAYETNQRLEREGFKLDTAEEQKASLAAALADYSYDTPTKQGKKKDKNMANTSNK